jgi:hypothetical protein
MSNKDFSRNRSVSPQEFFVHCSKLANVSVCSTWRHACPLSHRRIRADDIENVLTGAAPLVLLYQTSPKFSILHCFTTSTVCSACSVAFLRLRRTPVAINCFPPLDVSLIHSSHCATDVQKFPTQLRSKWVPSVCRVLGDQEKTGLTVAERRWKTVYLISITLERLMEVT